MIFKILKKNISNVKITSFYEDKIKGILKFFKNKKNIYFESCDDIDNFIYKIAKINVVIDYLDCDAYYSHYSKQIGLCSIINNFKINKEMVLITIFHELAHFFQYISGNIPKNNLFEELVFEQQAEAFSWNCINELYKNKKDELFISKEEISYFNKNDIKWLNEWYDFKDTNSLNRILKLYK